MELIVKPFILEALLKLMLDLVPVSRDQAIAIIHRVLIPANIFQEVGLT